MNAVTNTLSKNVGTHMYVEKIDFKFFNSLDINGVFVSDQQGDTLLYIDSFEAKFNPWGFTKQKILFSKVGLKGVYANAYKQDSVWNYQFLVDAFSPDTQKKDSVKKTIPLIEVKDVSISDVRLRYDSWYIDSLATDLSLNHFSTDSLNVEIRSLRIKEREGFEVKDLKTRFMAHPGEMSLRQFYLQLKRSEVDLQGEVYADGIDPRNNLPRLAVGLKVNKTKLVLGDIGRFVPALKNIRKEIDLSGEVRGRLDSVHIANLALDYDKNSIVRGNIKVVGLPETEDAYMWARLQDLRLDRSILQDFVSDMRNNPYLLPEFMTELGVMHYRGLLEGSVDSLNLNGAFTSRVGVITTKGHLKRDITKDTRPTFFIGDIDTHDFALGKLLRHKDLGNVSAHIHGRARVSKVQPFKANVNVHISAIEYRQYVYHDAIIDGEYHEHEFQGSMKIEDENITAGFNGLVDFRKDIPVYDFKLRVDTLNFNELHLSEKYNDATIVGSLTMKGSGNSLDNINGSVRIDSFSMRRTGKALNLPYLLAEAQTSKKKETSLRIHSDYLNADFTGNYTFSTLKESVQNLVMQQIPLILSEKDRRKLQRKPPKNEMTYRVSLENFDTISSVLELPVYIKGKSTIEGHLSDKDKQLAMQLRVPNLKAQKFYFEEIGVDVTNQNDELSLFAFTYKPEGQSLASKKLGSIDASVYVIAKNDSISLDARYQNRDTVHNSGNLQFNASVGELRGQPHIQVKFKPSQFIINDSIMRIAESQINYIAADTIIQIDDFKFGNSQCYVYANGTASTKETDSINIELNEIVLDYILEFTKVKESVDLGGAVTGNALVFSALRSPLFTAEVWMDSASINSHVLGDVHATADWDRQTKQVMLYADVVENKDTVALLDGTVQGDKWHLNIHPDSVSLGFINGWTQEFLDNLQGRAWGEVQVFGQKKETHVLVKAFADASVGIGYIGTRYSVHDSVFMDTTAIIFRDIHLKDDKQRELLFNGEVSHNGNFKDWKYRLKVHTDKAHVMSLPASKGQMFWGNVFASGDVYINGDELNGTYILADVRTENPSKFSLSVATASNASDNNFITFENHNSPEDTIQKEILWQPKQNVQLDLRIEATPAAEINIIIDPRSGDALKGRGEGNIRFNYNVNSGKIDLYGTYTLTSGSFNFTLENVIRKEFKIQEGSMVRFNGSPTNLEVDATALYQTTASLKDLFGSNYSSVSTNRSNVPVNVQLHLAEQIMNPVISFGIELPQSDESVQSQIKSIINNDEMLMRQVIYLLVFNRFYTPEYLQLESSSVGLNETYSLLSSTVTGQINSWLRRLTTNFSIGFNVRADGTGESASQEYETQFQYQPNNRLLINGNLGYRYNDLSNQPIFGNLDVEYLISQSGRWRVKAYTHTVDKYSIRTAHTIQGVGIGFKYDFNSEDIKNYKAIREREKQEREELRQERRERREQRKQQREERKRQREEKKKSKTLTNN